MKHKTKKRIKQAVSHLGSNLLLAIKELAEMMPEPFESKYEHQKRLRRMMMGSPAHRISRGLYRLREQGLIKSKQVSGRFIYNLTLDGYKKLLINKINQSPKIKNSKEGCIILFDIPESKRKHRVFLRRLLIKNGFINIQKSAMIAGHTLPPEFMTLMKELNLRQNITIVKGKIDYSN